MSSVDKLIKRTFDFAFALIALIMLSPLIMACVVIARLDTGASGIFRQTRIGQHTKPFTIYKIRTMREVEGSTITAMGDPRITQIGEYFRKFKLDELPQLVNVLNGTMSFVGPRPDVPGYMDCVGNGWSDVLDLRPGITGPATLKFRNEEELLAKADDPIRYNDEVIWPEKLRLNREYAQSWSLGLDLKIILKTALGSFRL